MGIIPRKGTGTRNAHISLYDNGDRSNNDDVYTDIYIHMMYNCIYIYICIQIHTQKMHKRLHTHNWNY